MVSGILYIYLLIQLTYIMVDGALWLNDVANVSGVVWHFVLYKNND